MSNTTTFTYEMLLETLFAQGEKQRKINSLALLLLLIVTAILLLVGMLWWQWALPAAALTLVFSLVPFLLYRVNTLSACKKRATAFFAAGGQTTVTYHFTENAICYSLENVHEREKGELSYRFIDNVIPVDDVLLAFTTKTGSLFLVYEPNGVGDILRYLTEK